MKSIILLSGGLDSTVNFCKALRESQVICALTFDYGQRASSNEVMASQKICAHYKVPHQVIRLDWLKHITHTALVNEEKELPKLNSSQLDDFEKTTKSAESVWVPNRNGVFISIAASFAESLKADQVVVGFNAEEAVTFPDNSADFIKRINSALELSTLSHPKIVCYTQNLNKREIVQLGQELKAPFDLMWSCYRAGKAMCGTCESCMRFYRAISLSSPDFIGGSILLDSPVKPGND